MTTLMNLDRSLAGCFKIGVSLGGLFYVEICVNRHYDSCLVRMIFCERFTKTHQIYDPNDQEIENSILIRSDDF